MIMRSRQPDTKAPAQDPHYQEQNTSAIQNPSDDLYSGRASLPRQTRYPTLPPAGSQEMTTTPAFHVGDPYIKVDQGFVCLPGPGYEELHPELKDLNPEDYPDIHKMAILADVAPYSREYHNVRQRVAHEAQGDTELEIEYEKIMNRVKQTRESIIKMNDRHFTAPVDEIAGTVDGHAGSIQ